MTDRTCQVCGVDISDKRTDAKVCGSSCRAAKARSNAPSKRHRPRAKRSGIEVYLPLPLARKAVSGDRNAWTEVLARIARLLDRKS